MGREAEVMTVGGGCSTARCLPLLLPAVMCDSTVCDSTVSVLRGVVRRLAGGGFAGSSRGQDSALLAGIVEPGLESKPSALFPGSSSDGLLMELPGLFPRPRSVGLGIIPLSLDPPHLALLSLDLLLRILQLQLHEAHLLLCLQCLLLLLELRLREQLHAPLRLLVCALELLRAARLEHRVPLDGLENLAQAQHLVFGIFAGDVDVHELREGAWPRDLHAAQAATARRALPDLTPSIPALVRGLRRACVCGGRLEGRLGKERRTWGHGGDSLLGDGLVDEFTQHGPVLDEHNDQGRRSCRMRTLR